MKNSVSQGKVSDAKLFLIKLQQDGKGYSTVKTVRGVLRPAFQMAVDDDLILKNPFGFQLAGVVVNDSVIGCNLGLTVFKDFVDKMQVLVGRDVIARVDILTSESKRR